MLIAFIGRQYIEAVLGALNQCTTFKVNYRQHYHDEAAKPALHR